MGEIRLESRKNRFCLAHSVLPDPGQSPRTCFTLHGSQVSFQKRIFPIAAFSLIPAAMEANGSNRCHARC
jgi:hypothetical protein